MAVKESSARRYAEAVFELALESDAFGQWSDDLATLATLVSDGEVAAVLVSGRIPREEKRRLLEAALSGQAAPQALNLALLLLDRGKITLAPVIARIFGEMVDAHRGVAHAVVTTAVPLTDDERRAVEERLSSMTGKQVEVTPLVDESIIGGVIARIGDQLIDGSTRTRLLALKRTLEGVAR
ncbi:MAG: ATP synthase F1 subunit delta [Dehalococcoidia bacterium]